MAKFKDESKEDAAEAAAEAKINNPDRPELATGKGVDLETLSHNWQPNSPAVDLRYPGTDGAVNVVEQAKAAQALAEGKEGPKPYVQPKKPVSQEEYDRRINLDVSNPLYINPSLDHIEVK